MQPGFGTGLLRAGTQDLRRARVARSSARHIVWQAARLWGGIVGIALGTAATVAAIGLAAVAIGAGPTPARILAILLEAPVAAVLLTIALGTWRWYTLAYALAPT